MVYELIGDIHSYLSDYNDQYESITASHIIYLIHILVTKKITQHVNKI